MTLTVETLARAIHEGRHNIPWKATSQQDLSFRDARAVLTAIERAGYVVVPREATTAMQNAAIDVDSRKLGYIAPLGFRCSPQMLFERCYAAMLSAAPKIQHSEGE